MFSNTFWSEEKPKKVVLLWPKLDFQVCVRHKIFHIYTYTQKHIYFLSALLGWWYLWVSSTFSCCLLCRSLPWQWILQRQRKRGSQLYCLQWHILLSNPIPHWVTYSRLPLQSSHRSHSRADLQVLIPVILLCKGLFLLSKSMKRNAYLNI